MMLLQLFPKKPRTKKFLDNLTLMQITHAKVINSFPSCYWIISHADVNLFFDVIIVNNIPMSPRPHALIWTNDG